MMLCRKFEEKMAGNITGTIRQSLNLRTRRKTRCSSVEKMAGNRGVLVKKLAGNRGVMSTADP